MVNKKLLASIKSQLEAYKQEREEIIGQSRKILQNSKTAIFALHRNDFKEAAKNLDDGEKIIKELNKKFNQKNRLQFEGTFLAAMEEYVEAKTLDLVMSGKSLDSLAIENIGAEQYVNGLADLTGELVRQAVLQATKGNNKVIEQYRSITEEVVGFMLSLYLTGISRQKFDEAKRNLKRLEEMIYQIKLKG